MAVDQRGVAIFVAVPGFNLLCNRLRDVFDPGANDLARRLAPMAVPEPHAATRGAVAAGSPSAAEAGATMLRLGGSAADAAIAAALAMTVADPANASLLRHCQIVLRTADGAFRGDRWRQRLKRARQAQAEHPGPLSDPYPIRNPRPGRTDASTNTMPFDSMAERESRASVVFRKVTGGFRSTWGPTVRAGYRSATSTARIAGRPADGAIRGNAETLFRPAAKPA